GILHFRGTIAAQEGDFDKAQELYRKALALAPLAPQTWFALAMIKTFKQGDPDLDAMERYRVQMAKAEPSVHARFLYALGKARHDLGDYDRAFEAYKAGADLRRQEEHYDAGKSAAFADRLINDFEPITLQALRPSKCESERAIFVNGLPRSGTTLVEQILTSHSAVSDGAEINLLRAALIPAGDYSFAGALACQRRMEASLDPWGELARDYLAMLNARFGSDGRIVDKTLNHSHFVGLLLHILPRAKIIWLRRNPEDSALSCFRSFFTQPMAWCWSLHDIALHFRQEDRLYRHWIQNFPDRILTVPYEDLASNPESWIPKILAHADLSPEPQVFEPHKQKRTVRTASVAQVRNPISTARIGAAKAYDRQMETFRDVYYEH
ncbi:MAG: sulfotransferase, partial [Amphiplicatus sp.]